MSGPQTPAKKVIQIEIGEGEDEAAALKRVAEERAAAKKDGASGEGSGKA